MPHNFAETIVQFGDPLGFRVRRGSQRPHVVTGAGTDTFKVEARTLVGHQKEAIVTEGADGSVWRLASDEGKVMQGDDLGPFPLGFFNAGVMGDIYNRIVKIAEDRGTKLGEVRMHMSHLFGSNGSFIQSTAKAYSESVDLRIEFVGELDAEDARRIVKDAFAASPAVGLLRHSMQENTFALYINGRRRKVIENKNSVAQDAVDPFLVYKSPPRPSTPDGRGDLIVKTDTAESGDTAAVPVMSTSKRLFSIEASGRSLATPGEFETETWIARPGMTHFKMITDETGTDAAPSGLALMSTGIGLCYLTQLTRYVHAQKLDIQGARLVQFNPYSATGSGRAGPIDTHLFLNGNAPDEIHLNLLTIAARTCFMHVAAATALEPNVSLFLNGDEIA